MTNVPIHICKEKNGVPSRAVMGNELTQIIKKGLARVAVPRKLGKVAAMLGVYTSEAGSLVGAGTICKDHMKPFARAAQ